MSRSLNKVMLIGNVGSEPEIRQTGSGKKLAKCSLATNRSFTDRNGQQQEKTEWHRLTFWDKLADIVEQYVHKGDRLYIEGRIEYSQTGEGDAVKYWTDIVVGDMVMLSGRDGGEGGGGGRSYGGGGREQGGWEREQSQPQQQQRKPQRQSAAPSKPPFEEEDDDLPF